MPIDKTTIQSLIEQIDSLQKEAHRLEKAYSACLDDVHPYYKESSRNLLHYLALRQHDIRTLQVKLSELGLSSLGRAESHVLNNLQAVRSQLGLLLGEESPNVSASPNFAQSSAWGKKHSDDLLDKPSPGRDVRIMVTFSTDLASDGQLVQEMLEAGMNCARINCAHDDETIWSKMIEQIRKAEENTGKKCKILFDLMGPKLRTGPLKPGPKVLVIQPEVDQLGQLTSPAKLWLTPAGINPPSSVNGVLPVPADWLSQVQVEDEIKFTDTRGRKRVLRVIQKDEHGVIALLLKTAYITTGTQLILNKDGITNQTTTVGELSAMEVPLLLKVGHELILHKEETPGEPASYDKNGQCLRTAHISCTLPQIFSQVKEGESILFDDGEIEGVILEVTEDHLKVKITGADEKGSKLRADKGINLPDSNLLINQLTDKDKEDLPFVAKHADIINLSFVNDPAIVEELQENLKKLKAEHVGIMLKIETKAGFSNLPHLLLTVMRSYPAGIMIARGDLAVECGWQRLAEVQEEILWICEAAHLPVVWATQVLEKLAKKGKPSRAEITDAAMAQRADCVMLNKGPFIVKAIDMLEGILKRMQEHQYKKTSLLRSLHVSEMSGFYLKNIYPKTEI